MFKSNRSRGVLIVAALALGACSAPAPDAPSEVLTSSARRALTDAEVMANWSPEHKALFGAGKTSCSPVDTVTPVRIEGGAIVSKCHAEALVRDGSIQWFELLDASAGEE